MIYTLRDNLKSQWWSIQMLKLQTLFRCFLVCFAMVQVMLSLSLLFIKFLGSCSRWRVTNGVMPCVLGPTCFYLKICVNIPTIKMLLCSSSECWCSSWHSSRFIIYECMMSSGFIPCVPHEFLGITHVL